MANLLFSVKLTVSGLEVPHVETFQTSTEVTAGSQMELVCAVSGKPQPTVYWTKGTDRIEPKKGTGLPGLLCKLKTSRVVRSSPWTVREILKGTNLIIYNADLSDSGFLRKVLFQISRTFLIL